MAILKSLDKIKKRLKNKERDYCIVVSGRERTGKSTFAAMIGDYIAEGKLNIDNICFTPREFVRAVNNSPGGDVIIFDEAGTGLFSRESMSKGNRILVQMMQVIGCKHNCTIMCIPDFRMIDSYIRKGRVDLHFLIHRKGHYKAYNRRLLEALLDSKKGYKIKPSASGTFKDAFPERLRKNYKAKELKMKTLFVKNLYQQMEQQQEKLEDDSDG